MCPRILAKSTFTFHGLRAGQHAASELDPDRTGRAVARALVSDVTSKARVQSLTGVAARLTNVARPMTSAP